MRKSLLASAVVAGLGLTSVAQSAIIVTYIPRGTPVNGATTATGFAAYTVRLTENTGANITAIDAESGTNGLFGPFVQRWSAPNDDGVYTGQTLFHASSPDGSASGNAQNLSNAPQNFDSHLLQPGNPKAAVNIVGAINPEESVGSGLFLPPGPNPPFPNNSDGTGITTSINGFMQMAYGINGPAQSPVVDYAYIVIPAAYVGDPTRGGFGSALIAVAGGNPQLVTFPFIPEPGTMALAGVSALGLLARRRKA